ncbi:MAG: hypothetical protein HDQ98_17615 [Lachnospiraceae bacterium]|nr:hypothetical protein [Lachnospiraceae bacterium]
MRLEIFVESVLESIRTSIVDFRNVGVSRELVWYHIGKLETLHSLELIEEAVYAELKLELESFLYS